VPLPKKIFCVCWTFYAYFQIDNKAQDKIEALEGDIEQVKHNLEHLIDFAIAYFTKLKRSTERTRTPNGLRIFDDIEATKVVLRILNYTSIKEGFGNQLEKTNTTDCSDIDDVIVSS
jgi:topoisomerase-4 subunit A